MEELLSNVSSENYTHTIKELKLLLGRWCNFLQYARNIRIPIFYKLVSICGKLMRTVSVNQLNMQMYAEELPSTHTN